MKIRLIIIVISLIYQFTFSCQQSYGQTFSFQKNSIIIKGKIFQLCNDTNSHPCDSNFRISKFIEALGVEKDIKFKNGKKKFYKVTQYYHDSMGIDLIYAADWKPGKNWTEPIIEQIDFIFWKNSSIPIDQNILLYNLHITNNLTYDSVINNLDFNRQILKTHESGDSTLKVIDFKIFNNNLSIGMNFIKKGNTYLISEIFVGLYGG